MIRQSIARRYAKGLFAVGEKDGRYALYLEELNRVVSRVESEGKLKRALMLPLVELEKRKDLLSDVVRALAISPQVGSLLQMLLDKNKIGYLPLIRDVYAELIDEREGVTKGILYTAYPLPQDVRTRIEEVMAQRLKKRVQLAMVEEKGLIGGVKVVVGGLQIDGSVKRQLEILNESIMKE